MKKIHIFLLSLLAACCLAFFADAEELVGSRTSNKYHRTTCEWAVKIQPERKIVFRSPEEAKKANYLPCPLCRPPLVSSQEVVTEKKIPVIQSSEQLPGVQPEMKIPEKLTEAKNVLFITVENNEYTTSVTFTEAVKKKLAELSRAPLNYSYEYINMNYYYANAVREAELVYFLKQKYYHYQPDIVIAHAASFMKKYSEVIFPGVPVIYSGNEMDLSDIRTSPNLFCYQEAFNLTKALQLIMRNHPDTKKIYIVIGDSEEERKEVIAINKITRNYETPVDFVYLNNQTFDNMLETLKKLDVNSVVLYFHIFRDVAGNSYIPVKALMKLREETPVPIYVIDEQYLGNGALGGYLYNRQNQGRHIAEIAAVVLKGKKISEIKPEAVSFGEYVFDEQELKRWKINESKLPPGARIEYKRDYNSRDSYQWYFAGLLILIVGEAVIIVVLLLKLYRRRKDEARTRVLEDVIGQLKAAKEFQAATAAELAKLYGQQYMTSRKDRLTGLYNRRHLEEKIQEEYAYFSRKGRLFSVLLTDIDFFKKVNDTYGHDAGDCLLKAIADVLQDTVRAFDLVARWGGEEFLILLPEIDLEGASALAERIRKTIEEKEYPYNDIKLKITMTFGVATIRANDTVDDVIKRADNALYEGKNGGRNRVVSS